MLEVFSVSRICKISSVEIESESPHEKWGTRAVRARTGDSPTLQGLVPVPSGA